VKEKDPRFWFPKVPVLMSIRANGPKDSTEALINYLEQAPENGFDIIARPYLTVKMGLQLEALKRKPKYLQMANKIYSRLEQMILGIRVNVTPTETQVLTKAGGITLLGQPQVIRGDWMMPSQRPTDVRYPRFFTKGKPPAIQQAKSALRLQLDHGVAWASGLSGSTNMDLFAWHWLKTHNKESVRKEIDGLSSFLGILLFLVYDGGHSISETLWTVNELDAEMHLNFNFSKKARIDLFLPDFNQFLDAYKSNQELHEALEKAFNHAFDVVIEYAEKFGPNDPKSSFHYSF
jgi:hypothetical protein